MSDLISVWPQDVRLIDVVRHRPGDPYRRHLVADTAALKAIARALDIKALERLDAELALHGWFDGAEIHGRWTASVEQVCGLTLEPFSAALEGDFTVRVVPKGSVHAPDETEEVVIDLEADDPPDVLEADVIDLGAYVVEHLALEIDPFPRKPDAVFEPPEPEVETSPFAVLRGFKPKDPPANDS